MGWAEVEGMNDEMFVKMMCRGRGGEGRGKESRIRIRTTSEVYLVLGGWIESRMHR